MDARDRSTASILALVLAGLILYASLYPFAPWRLQGVEPWDWLWAPWSRYWTWFDVLSNLFGYIPLGFLLVAAQIRSRWPAWSLPLAVLAPALLSFAVETVQSFLLPRVPSRLDFALNAAGGLLGALIAWALVRAGAQRRWDAVRQRWFEPQARGTLVLLALWPFALLYPAPVPFGLGQVAGRLSALLDLAVQDTPFQAWLPAGAPALAPLGPLAQALCVAMGLLAPVLLAFSDMRSRRRRALLLLMLCGLGMGVSGLSAALTWGPVHAWAWVSPALWLGLALAMLVGLAAAMLPRRLCTALLLLGLGALLAVLNRAPASPYLAESLQLWEQGRFIRFHGLSQWLGWIWPYAALIHGIGLLLRPHGSALVRGRN